jgi:hypothetical protein
MKKAVMLLCFCFSLTSLLASTIKIEVNAGDFARKDCIVAADVAKMNLTKNNGVGPFGHEIKVNQIDIGDVIQLGNSKTFYHTLIVSKVDYGRIFVCSHTRDTLNVPLENYYIEKIRCIKISGYRTK